MCHYGLLFSTDRCSLSNYGQVLIMEHRQVFIMDRYTVLYSANLKNHNATRTSNPCNHELIIMMCILTDVDLGNQVLLTRVPYLKCTLNTVASAHVVMQ